MKRALSFPLSLLEAQQQIAASPSLPADCVKILIRRMAGDDNHDETVFFSRYDCRERFALAKIWADAVCAHGVLLEGSLAAFFDKYDPRSTNTVVIRFGDRLQFEESVPKRGLRFLDVVEPRLIVTDRDQETRHVFRWAALTYTEEPAEGDDARHCPREWDEAGYGGYWHDAAFDEKHRNASRAYHYFLDHFNDDDKEARDLETYAIYTDQ